MSTTNQPRGRRRLGAPPPHATPGRLLMGARSNKAGLAILATVIAWFDGRTAVVAAMMTSRVRRPRAGTAGTMPA